LEVTTVRAECNLLFLARREANLMVPSSEVEFQKPRRTTEFI
jgi:hypothetical protein